MPVPFVLAGAAAGAAGAAAMVVTERLEQLATRRPDSMVPGRAMAHVLRLRDPDADSRLRMYAMHYGTGAAVGVVRAGMARANLRGPTASWMHLWLRLAVDQTVENATGVGAPPPTWPRDELVADVAHKGVYAVVTGLLADALVDPAPGTSVQRPAQGLRLQGFA